MNIDNEQTSEFIKSEFNKVQIEIAPKESGREGVDFILKTNTGNLHEVYLQPINLNKERSVKILKQDLGEPKGNLWVALVLIMDNEPINFYLIIHSFILFFKGIHECFAFPSKTVTKPDGFVFIENEVSSFPQLSNWETVGSRTPRKAICLGK